MDTSSSPLSPKELEEAFIKVTFEEDTPVQPAAGSADPFYDSWVEQGA